MLFSIHCSFDRCCSHCVCAVCVGSLFYGFVLDALSSLAISLLTKSYGCLCSVSLPSGAMGWSAVCDCSIS